MHSFVPILGFTVVSISAHALNIKRDLTVSTDLPSAWTSSGCYSDIRSARALTAGYTSSSQMTEIMCIEYCDQKGFSYAGVEYGQECYCGYGVSNNQHSIDSSKCNMACPGSPSTPCGGPDAINIFTNGHAGPVENPGVLNYVSLGCYSDSQSARTLDTFKPSSDGITFVLGCIEVCSGAGYQYAGLEYRQECWCGNSLRAPGHPIDDSACNMPCNGNSTEQCGGSDAINIYQNAAAISSSISSTLAAATSSAVATTTITSTTMTTASTSTTTSVSFIPNTTGTSSSQTTAVIAPSCAPAAGSNLNNIIANPSFESSPAWNVGGSSSIDTDVAYDGCNSLLLPGFGSGFTQTFINAPLTQQLTPNQYYTLTFFQGVPAGSTNNQPTISGTLAGQRFGQGSACSSCSIARSNGSTWQKITFRAPAGSRGGLQIVITGTDGFGGPILLDNFSLVQS